MKDKEDLYYPTTNKADMEHVAERLARLAVLLEIKHQKEKDDENNKK